MYQFSCFHKDIKGRVILDVENTGLFNKIAQNLFNKPQYTKVHLDAQGTFIWPMIDGKRTVEDIAALVKEEFGDAAEPPTPTPIVTPAPAPTETAEQAYSIYQEALKINMGLNDQWEDPTGLISSPVRVEQYSVEKRYSKGSKSLRVWLICP